MKIQTLTRLIQDVNEDPIMDIQGKENLLLNYSTQLNNAEFRHSNILETMSEKAQAAAIKNQKQYFKDQETAK